MELELLLNEGLNELISEAFDEVELVFENNKTEKHLSVLVLSPSELALSYFPYFFHYRLNPPLQVLIEGHKFQSPIDRIWAFTYRYLVVSTSVFRVN
jgi:hypothetical protein